MEQNKADLYFADSEQWENGTYGEQEEFAVRAEVKHELALDEAMGMQMISIRLPKRMIEDLKFIAKAHGIGYQPLIRDQLHRFIVHEWKEILRNTAERRAIEAEKIKQDEVEADEVIQEIEERERLRA